LSALPDWREGARILGIPFSTGPTRRKSSACCQIAHVQPGTNILGIKSCLPIRWASSAPRIVVGSEESRDPFPGDLVRARRRDAGQSISGPERPFPKVALCERADPGRQTISEFNLSRFGYTAYPRSFGSLARESGRRAASRITGPLSRSLLTQPVQVY